MLPVAGWHIGDRASLERCPHIIYTVPSLSNKGAGIFLANCPSTTLENVRPAMPLPLINHAIRSRVLDISLLNSHSRTGEIIRLTVVPEEHYHHWLFIFAALIEINSQAISIESFGPPVHSSTLAGLINSACMYATAEVAITQEEIVLDGWERQSPIPPPSFSYLLPSTEEGDSSGCISGKDAVFYYNINGWRRWDGRAKITSAAPPLQRWGWYVEDKNILVPVFPWPIRKMMTEVAWFGGNIPCLSATQIRKGDWIWTG